MGRFALIALLITLAACGKTEEAVLPTYYSVAETPYPPEVLANLPADIPTGDIIARVLPGELGPCYFYRQDGQIYPLTLAENAGTAFENQPYCIQ